MTANKSRFQAFCRGEVDCRACPESCRECLGADCECYEHQDDAPTDDQMIEWLREMGR
jgi:hypothetical protein